MGIMEIISLILFLLNIVMSIMAGRKYAQLKHDATLVRKKLGKNLMFFVYLPLYLMIIFIICINLCYMVFSHGLSLMLSTILGLLGLIANPYMGFIISVILITASYFYYNHRYKKVDKPLTRYAKLLIKQNE